MSIKNQRGLSMVELLITMVIFMVAMVAASNIFIGVIGQFKQQSKIAETNIEGMVGLQMLKADIEQAGYGLPYNMNGANYADEAANDPVTAWNDSIAKYNDAPNGVPRALLVDNNVSINSSDLIVVKATNVAINDTAQKWAYMSSTGTAASNVPVWQNSAGVNITEENLQANDRVTVVTANANRTLQVSGAFYSTFVAAQAAGSGFAPLPNSFDTYIMYGIAPDGVTPRMPFNRADYYVRTPVTMPTQCAPGTGVLYKATIRHDGGMKTEYPLLDCVATMKVVIARDINADGVIDSYLTSGWPVGTTADEIRAQMKQVRVYLLLHEGQRDATFQSPATMTIADPDAGNLLVYNVPDRNYRWKIFTMVMTPANMR